MRALASTLLTVAACSARPAPAVAPGPAPILDAYVVDEHGPVAGANVALVALPDGRCPCAAPFDTSGYGNEMPACACPEALARWRTRLASCLWPSQAVSTVATDVHGHAALSRAPGVTGIEVERGAGVRWLPWPPANRSISLELARSISPRVTLEGAKGVPVHGAFVFDDGHCVPLDRAGDAWGPRVPLPRFEISGGTLVVEAPGYATIVYSLFDQEEISLALHPARTATGTCDGTLARLDNPFQHLIAKPDASKQFAFTGALDVPSKVSCWADATDMIDEWDFTPEYGLEEANLVVGGYGSCDEVKVVDARNAPLEGADVTLFFDHGGGDSSGTGTSTDARGIACVEYLSAGGELVVHPPPSLGGECAGEVRVKLTQQHLANQPLVLRVRAKKLSMARPRGRIVNRDGAPVANAHVAVGSIEPSSTPDCSERGDASVTTAADGTFTLPPQPRGTLTLDVHHDWYAEQLLTIKNDGSAHDIVLDRGDRWTGRVLDPDGRPIEQCTLFLTLANRRLLSTTCSKTGFSFGTLTPGDAELQVRVEKHALGTFRTLRKKLHIDAGRPLTLDLAFPRGEHITGRVVDSKGNAVPRARLTAVPTGTRQQTGRFHDDEIMLEADANGQFALRHLRPGTWTVTTDRRSGRQTTFDVATGTKDVELVIPDPPRP